MESVPRNLYFGKVESGLFLLRPHLLCPCNLPRSRSLNRCIRPSPSDQLNSLDSELPPLPGFWPLRMPGVSPTAPRNGGLNSTETVGR
jgi:hypothetical protein